MAQFSSSGANSNINVSETVGYITVNWLDLLSTNEVIATVNTEEGLTGYNSQSHLRLPIGSKLLSLCITPCTYNTKQATELLYNHHSKSSTAVSAQCRLYLGVSHWGVNDVPTFAHSAADLDRARRPVGRQPPMNNTASYVHMRPSLTAEAGRPFGEVSTPCWINAWQSDTIGMRVCPFTPDLTTRRSGVINCIFKDFDVDEFLKQNAAVFAAAGSSVFGGIFGRSISEHNLCQFKVFISYATAPSPPVAPNGDVYPWGVHST
jgi:hypothetical protein